MNQRKVDHYRSIMIYLNICPLANELGLSPYATRLLHIIAVHTHEKSPVTVSQIVKLWQMDEESVRIAIGEFTLWNGYVSFGEGGKLYANFDTLSSFPLWSTYWDALLHPLSDAFLSCAYRLIGDAQHHIA